MAEKGDERGLQSRPFSKCPTCGIDLCLSKKGNCFKKFHDTKYCQPSNADESIYGSDSNSAQDDCAGEEDSQQLIDHPHRTIVSFVMTDFRDDYVADRDVIQGNRK